MAEGVHRIASFELELELEFGMGIVDGVGVGELESVCVSNTVALSCVDIVANED